MAFNYVGNPDFRGYLAYQAKAGDPNAASALQWTGNDGNINPDAAQGIGPGDSMYLAQYVKGQFDNFNNAKNAQTRTPAAPPPPGSGGSGDTTGGDLAYLDDQEGQLRRQLSSAQAARVNGSAQIGDSYNKEVGRANEQESAAETKYATNREDTTRDKVSAIDKVNTGARTLADSVRRILGLASGSNSSAFQQTAPGAIARDATGKRTNVVDTFGRNLRDIDTAEQGTKSNFKNLLDDLLEQRKQKQQSLEEGVLGQEQGIYGNLATVASQRAQLKGGGYGAVRAATAPLLGEINNRQNTLDNIFSQYRTPYNVKPVEVNTPSLADYTVDKTALNTADQQGSGAVDNGTSPYSSFLRKRFGLEPATA